MCWKNKVTRQLTDTKRSTDTNKGRPVLAAGNGDFAFGKVEDEVCVVGEELVAFNGTGCFVSSVLSAFMGILYMNIINIYEGLRVCESQFRCQAEIG